MIHGLTLITSEQHRDKSLRVEDSKKSIGTFSYSLFHTKKADFISIQINNITVGSINFTTKVAAFYGEKPDNARTAHKDNSSDHSIHVRPVAR
jgi:hypothetical protein